MRFVPLLTLLLATIVRAETTRALTPNEMHGIRVWDQGRSGMMRGSKPGTLRLIYHAQFKNETPRELASLRVRMVVDAGRRRAYVSPEKSLTRFENLSVPITGALAPMNKTGYVEGIAFELPQQYWRTNMYDRLEVVGATTFVDPNLHNAGHLYARLMNGKDDEEIQLLKRDPSLLKVRNAEGFDLTLMAFATCGPAMIRYALAHGGSVKDHTTLGSGIMHMAALNGFPGVDDLALKLGGDVNSKTKHGKTPLLKAIVSGAMTLDWLLAHGANPRYEESPGHTVAQYAIREGHAPALAALVKAGLSPRSKDSTGQGWFHYAVFNYMMMDAVASYGVPVDDPNSKTGETPLMEAVWSGWTEPQVWLLQHGADPNRKDKKGRTAYDYAGTYSLERTVAAYKAKGLKLDPATNAAMRLQKERARAYFAGLVRQYAGKG